MLPAATLSPDSPRADTWRRRLGDLTVPVLSPVTSKAILPGRGVCEVYWVDLARLPESAVEQLIASVAAELELAPDVVRAGIWGGDGMPVLAEDVSVVFDARTLL